MPFFSDEIVERVREAVDIVEIIGDYLPLKRKGRNYWARCPFHQEKTPSFSVSPDKQIFHCFGCQKGGNVYSFLMEYEKVPFPEAVKILAAKANIELPKEDVDSRRSEELEQLYYALEVATKFFEERLRDSRKALEYLKQREIADDTIERFKIGYSVEGWDNLINHARSKSISMDTLEKAGLIMARESSDGYYDRFRDRLMFTIFNTAQKAIAFGGRTFNDAEQAKYINSPETQLYHKARVLYGLSHSRGEIRRAGEAIVVEGYFDFLTLYQAGLTNVVASSGTAFTAEQAQLLSRSAEGVVLMFDSDSAGRQAALRSVDHLFEAGLEVKVVQLPTGDDPDSIVRSRGVEEAVKLIKRAQSYVDFTYSTLPAPWAELSLGMKEKAIKRLTDVAGKISDPVRRELFLQETAEKYNIALATIKSSLRVATTKAQPRPVQPEKAPLERDLLAVLLQQPVHVDAATDRIAPEQFGDEVLGEIYSLIVLLREEEIAITPSQLIDKVESAAKKERIAELAALDFGDVDFDRLFQDLLTAFEIRYRQERLRELKRLLADAERDENEEQVKFYMNEIKSLQVRR